MFCRRQRKVTVVNLLKQKRGLDSVGGLWKPIKIEIPYLMQLRIPIKIKNIQI